MDLKGLTARMQDTAAHVNCLAWLGGEDGVVVSDALERIFDDLDDDTELRALCRLLGGDSYPEDELPDGPEDLLELAIAGNKLGLLAQVYFLRRANFTETGCTFVGSSWVSVLYAETLEELVAQIEAQDQKMLERDRELEAKAKVGGATPGVCRVCGCTDECACPGGCSWVESDLCSACADREVPA